MDQASPPAGSDELREALEDVNLTEKKHSEITELMDTLRGNLDKVMQHGKRADAIVKNMLPHSREGSGEHRLVDINAIVEESLNLAYHGARAETQGFNDSGAAAHEGIENDLAIGIRIVRVVLVELLHNYLGAALGGLAVLIDR